jgi:hypothetical protein
MQRNLSQTISGWQFQPLENSFHHVQANSYLLTDTVDEQIVEVSKGMHHLAEKESVASFQKHLFGASKIYRVF